MSRQTFTPGTTTWHITWGTYGTRLHGDDRPTVDKQHNTRSTPFLGADDQRRSGERDRQPHPAVRLTREQCLFIQEKIPAICERGGWELRVCAAAPDHVHVLLDINPEIHGQKVRRLLKRWVTEALNQAWPPGSGRPGSLAIGATWWAEEGSNKAIKDIKYLNNAFNYVHDQRMT